MFLEVRKTGVAAMSETLKTRPAAGSASAFVVQSEVPSPQTDMWSQAGAAIELAYRTPVPATRAGRVAIALALVVATKLFRTGGCNDQPAG
jgi:hypothetical protein